MSHKKSGFVALIGRPNVGKSTLMNTICGHKIAIVSHVPQTTRNMIKGIFTEGDTQMVFLDTPGIHESAKMYNKILSSQATEATSEADVILYLVDVSRPFGREEEVIMEMLKAVDKPVIIAFNKVDIKGERVAEQSLKLNELFADFPKVSIHYISGLRGSYLDPLLADIEQHLPEGEFYYPAGMYTDQTIDFMVAEVVRESVLHHTFEEVPHATRTEVAHIDESGEHILSLFVDIFVERETQKGILIGKKADKLKEIGTDARLKLEKMFHKKIFLKLQVKVDAGWRGNR